MLLYLGTDQLYAKLAEKVDKVRELINGVDGNILEPRYIAAAEKLLASTGFSEITGFGLSEVEIEGGVYRRRLILHHYPDKGEGHFWSFFGGEPHEPAGLDLMPANTVLAGSQDLNLKGIWQAFDQEIKALGEPEINAPWEMVSTEFKKATEMELGAFLDSLGGQFGIAVTLDEKETISVPGADGKPLEIPRPEVVVVAKMNDRLVFERLVELVKPMGLAISKSNGIEQLQLPMVFPPVPSLQPVLAFDGEHLLLCSSPEMLKTVLAVKAGEQAGLATRPGFKKLSGMATTRGNGFSYVDRRLGEAFKGILSAVMADAPPEIKGFESLLGGMFEATEVYGVFENTDQGWIWTGVGNQSAGEAMAAAGTAFPLLLPAIALPNFMQARSKAERFKCVNNLKQVSLGLKIYAADHNDRYPFQISVAKGGTREQTKQDARGDDLNPFVHLLMLKNELGSPRILTCPAHEGIDPATRWSRLAAGQISYKFRTGKAVDEFKPDEAMVWCPIHHNVAFTDGSVRQLTEKETKARTAGSWKPGKTN